MADPKSVWSEVLTVLQKAIGVGHRGNVTVGTPRIIRTPTSIEGKKSGKEVLGLQYSSEYWKNPNRITDEALIQQLISAESSLKNQQAIMQPGAMVTDAPILAKPTREQIEAARKEYARQGRTFRYDEGTTVSKRDVPPGTITNY